MSRPAYVLPEDAISGTAAVTFAGFPGIWTPGEPIAAAELVTYGGFVDEDALAEKVEELGLPLEHVVVDDDKGAMPETPNHLQSRSEAAVEALENTPRKRSHADLDAQAEELGLTFSTSKLTVAEKQSEIDAHVVAAELQPQDPEEPDGDA